MPCLANGMFTIAFRVFIDVALNQGRFVPVLETVSGFVVPVPPIHCVGSGQSSHEVPQVRLSRFQEDVKVVGHASDSTTAPRSAESPISLGSRTALGILENYVKGVRPFLLRDRAEQALFLDDFGHTSKARCQQT